MLKKPHQARSTDAHDRSQLLKVAKSPIFGMAAQPTINLLDKFAGVVQPVCPVLDLLPDPVSQGLL